MLLQHFQFAIDDPIDCDGGMWEDELAEGVSVSVRLRVVDGEVTGPCGGRGIDAVVGNTPGKRGSDRDTAGLHVVFHVVRWGVGQKNRWLCGSDDRAYLAKIRLRVFNFEIVADGGIIRCPEDRCGSTALLFTLGSGLLCRHRRRAAAAVGKVDVVEIPAQILEQQQGSGRHELDVIGMGKNGECGWHDARGLVQREKRKLKFFDRIVITNQEKLTRPVPPGTTARRYSITLDLFPGVELPWLTGITEHSLATKKDR